MIPLAYLATIAGILGMLYLHLESNIAWLAGKDSNLALGLLYLSIAISLGVTLFYLLHPFFQKNQDPKSGMILTAAKEPRLYAFVNQVCLALGSNVPDKISVNMDINASARFAPGWLGLYKGELELLVGLPLVKGLELDEFVAVLAHELGHFRQGIAMRLVQCVRTQIHWFGDAAVREAEWELELKRKAYRFSLLLYIPGWMAIIFKGMVRQIQHAFMRAGQSVSCLLLRQMEFEADRAAIRMVGGETFVAMVLQAKVLEAAWGLANRSLGLALREGRLADDLPALVYAHTRVFIPEVRRKMERGLANDKTAWFDTHPSLGERIIRARKGIVRGVFHAKGKAHALFNDFPELSKQATAVFYQQDLGDDFNPSRMISTADLVSGQSQIQIGESALNGYFLGLLSNLRPIWISSQDFNSDFSNPSAYFSLLRKDLDVARKKIESNANIAAQVYQELSLSDAKMVDAVQALALIRANFWVEPGDFQLRVGGAHQAAASFDAAETNQKLLGENLRDYEEAMRLRLVSAISLLQDPIVSSLLPDSQDCYREAIDLVPGLQAMAKVQPQLESLRRAWSGLGILLENYPGNEKTEELQVQLRAQALAIRLEMDVIRTEWANYTYPFAVHSHGNDLAAYAFDSMPEEFDFHSHYAVAEEVMSRCYAFYFRVMGRLALSAGRVEGVLGLGPIQVNGPD